MERDGSAFGPRLGRGRFIRGHGVGKKRQRRVISMGSVKAFHPLCDRRESLRALPFKVARHPADWDRIGWCRMRQSKACAAAKPFAFGGGDDAGHFHGCDDAAAYQRVGARAGYTVSRQSPLRIAVFALLNAAGCVDTDAPRCDTSGLDRAGRPVFDDLAAMNDGPSLWLPDRQGEARQICHVSFGRLRPARPPATWKVPSRH